MRHDMSGAAGPTAINVSLSVSVLCLYQQGPSLDVSCDNARNEDLLEANLLIIVPLSRAVFSRLSSRCAVISVTVPCQVWSSEPGIENLSSRFPYTLHGSSPAKVACSDWLKLTRVDDLLTAV
jgi:hypothetical protein